MLPPSVACGDSALPERANKALLILTPTSCALAGGLFAGLGAGGLGGGLLGGGTGRLGWLSGALQQTIRHGIQLPQLVDPAIPEEG